LNIFVLTRIQYNKERKKEDKRKLKAEW